MTSIEKKFNKELNNSYKALSSKNPIGDLEILKYYKEKALQLGASKAIITNPSKDCVFQEKVKLSCANNCERYGTKLSCPPHIPDLNYEKAIKEYDLGLIVMVERNANTPEQFSKTRTESTNKLHKILLQLEQTAFNEGFYLATSFIGGSCKLCNDCSDICKNPKLSRIPLEATGMNVVKTLENLEEKISFPVSKYKKFSRTGLFLLSE